LIYDGARPFVSEELIRTTLTAAQQFGAAVPGLTPIDSQKEINEEGFIVRHLVRSSLCAVQTPQCFEFSKLLAAHERAALDGREYTDDTEIWGSYCGRVKVVPGEVNNIKITYPADLEKLRVSGEA
jgi:2-C-methyl-D-erythritol 4-phosphate cytidylyltransferase/2-C-methyl-D-erythritol 4-phosphate cytidylyltransferase/2-C-methyl-D-erythritol 2,4-cyclodiphosphate synthase